jgi:hypothetical protein
MSLIFLLHIPDIFLSCYGIWNGRRMASTLPRRLYHWCGLLPPLRAQWIGKWGFSISIANLIRLLYQDQPMYTQPLLYDKINNAEHSLVKYEKFLVGDGSCTQKELDEIKNMVCQQRITCRSVYKLSWNQVKDTMESEYEASKTWETPKSDWLSSRWRGYVGLCEGI